MSVSKNSKRFARNVSRLDGLIKVFYSMFRDANIASLLLMTVTTSNWTPYSIEYAVGRWRRRRQCVRAILLFPHMAEILEGWTQHTISVRSRMMGFGDRRGLG